MAGSINLANVALGFDSSKITKGVDLSAAELRKLTGIVKQSESSIDKYNTELRILETAYGKGALSAKRMAEAVEMLKKKHDQLDVGTMTNKWTELNSKVSLLKDVFHGYVVAFDLIKQAASTVFDEMNRIDKINDQAHKLGVSFADLNTIQIALGDSSGVAADDIAKALQKLSLGVVEAVSTSKGAAFDALETLKIDPSKLGAQSAVQQLTTIIDAMEGIKDQGERLKLSFDLFGKSGAALVAGFDEGSKQLSEANDFAKEFGLNLSGPVVEGINNANDAMGRLKLASQGVLSNFAGGIAPAIGAIAADLTGMAGHAEAVSAVAERMGRHLAANYGIMKDLAAFTASPLTTIAKGVAGQSNTMQMMRDIDAAKQKAIEDAKNREEKSKRDKIIGGEAAAAEKQRVEAEKLAKQELLDLEDSYKRGWVEYEEREKKRILKEEYAYKEANIRVEFAERNKKEMDNMGKLNGSNVSAPTLRAGSVEAYKFMMSQKDKQAEATERHIKVSEESKNILEKQLDALNHQRTMQTKR